MKRYQVTRESFMKDVAEHGSLIVLDQGVHRHVKARRPGTYCMGFDIVTWPDHLAISGDMGCYVFTRLPDMFEFFRRPDGRELEINQGYWEEKACAVGRHDPTRAYSPDRFREKITTQLDEAVERGDCSPDTRGIALSELLPHADDGEYEARRAVENWNGGDAGFEFSDFWECDLREFTLRFEWCLWAIVWAIREYDRLRVPAAEVLP